ncbi:hypothetical protein Trydic_g8529 [Trypoxylus dichotomus]
MLLERQQRKGFLHRFVAGDEKKDLLLEKLGYRPGRAGPSQPKRNTHSDTVILCIYYELLKPSKTTTGEVYRRQPTRGKRVVPENRPKWQNRHDKLILQHDNPRPHTVSVKTYLKRQDQEVYLFLSMQLGLQVV